jgi:hypothetical protein
MERIFDELRGALPSLVEAIRDSETNLADP